MQKQVNINCPDNDKEKVLKRLVPFFYNKNEYMVNNNVQVLAITMYGGAVCPEIVLVLN
jgi:CYTH domain-containing protein